MNEDLEKSFCKIQLCIPSILLPLVYCQCIHYFKKKTKKTLNFSNCYIVLKYPVELLQVSMSFQTIQG